MSDVPCVLPCRPVGHGADNTQQCCSIVPCQADLPGLCVLVRDSLRLHPTGIAETALPPQCCNISPATPACIWPDSPIRGRLYRMYRHGIVTAGIACCGVRGVLLPPVWSGQGNICRILCYHHGSAYIVEERFPFFVAYICKKTAIDSIPLVPRGQ